MWRASATPTYIQIKVRINLLSKLWIIVSKEAKISKWVWSGNTTITNYRQPRGTARKSRSTITRHQEDKLNKATSALFPIKMIAIPEWTYSNVQQNIELLQTPTMGVTINKKSTTTEPPSKNRQQPKPLKGLNAFYWYQIFALDSAVVEVQEMLARMEAI